MEKLHSSRPWRKNIIGSAVMAATDYDDVFGGAPRHTAPFSLQLDDYFEIFGSAASASSIPLLDLPPADDFETVGGVDYSDVFGIFGGGVFAASYEELFPELKRSGVSSLEGRTRWDVLTEQQEKKVLEQPLKVSNEYDANLEMNQHSSVSELSEYVSSKQFMPHHRTSQEPFNDVLSEKKQKSKLDALPGYSIVFDTIDSAHEKKNKSVNKGTIDSTGTQKYALNGEQKNKATHYFYSSAKNSLVNLKSDMTPPKSNCASLPDVSRDEKHHSRSSSYHSTSSGDIPFDDSTYLQVSEISLQTKPLQGPPPSRPPPELSKKAEDPEVMHTDSIFDIEERSFLKPRVNNQLHSKNEATEINKIDESKKDINCLHDDEMDSRSAAALSIAAVKEAMEQAQAQIKSAKDLMDRKCHKPHRKVSLMPKALNSKEDGAACEVEPKSCRNMIDSNNLFKKISMISECTFAREEIRTEGKTALNHEEIKVQIPPYKKDQQQVTKENASDSSEIAFKIVDIPGEWEIDKKYYERIMHDIFFNTAKDIYIQGDEKKEKAGEDKVIDKELKKAIEVEENRKSIEVSFCIEKLKKDDLKGLSMACTEDVNKNLVDLDEFLLKDTPGELEEAFGSKEPGENQNLSDAQNDNTNDNKISESNFAHDSCLHKESANSSQYSNHVFKVGVANENCEERQLKAAEVVSGYVECKRKFNVSCLESELNDSYKEVKVPNETLLQAIFEKKIRLPEELFAYNPTDKKEVAEEYKPYSNYENETGRMEHKYSYDAFRCKIENSVSAAEKDEGDGLQTNEVMHKLEENDLEQEVLQDENELEVTEEYKPYINYENETGRMKHNYSYDMFRCKIENSDSAVERVEGYGLQTNKDTHILEENKLEQEVLQDENGLENLKIPGKIKNAELEQILNSRKGSCHRDCNKKESSEAGTSLLKDESMGALINQEVQDSEFLGPAEVACDKRLSENITEVPVPDKFVENQISLNSAAKTSQLAEIEDSETQAILSRKESSLPVVAQDSTEVSHTQMAENYKRSCREEEENRRKINIDRERDEEQKLRLEEKELEREREKDKIALEQANYETRQQELAEAQKRAERIAVERATAEARQRAFADAREKAEKAAEAEKASREARLRAERAAVERATEEARRRAIEKALAEKANAGARERTTQVSSSNKDRMRKDNGIAHFKANHIKEDSEARHKSTSTNAQSHSATCFTNGHRYSDSSNIGGTVSNMRCKAEQERQRQTAERAANALSEKNIRDLLAQREQAERDRLAESLDFVVKKWSFGKDGNLRLLLSTLQYILVPESGWQSISLTDLINAPAVKKAYRKATLCVHPDKLQQRGATIQQKYICEKVFDLLKEAWDKFNSEER